MEVNSVPSFWKMWLMVCMRLIIMEDKYRLCCTKIAMKSRSHKLYVIIIGTYEKKEK